MRAAEPVFACLFCLDGGWRPFWCLGAGEARTLDQPARADGSIVDCGRQTPHSGHQYVAPCACLATNPVIARRREREQVRRDAQKGRAA